MIPPRKYESFRCLYDVLRLYYIKLEVQVLLLSSSLDIVLDVNPSVLKVFPEQSSKPTELLKITPSGNFLTIY